GRLLPRRARLVPGPVELANRPIGFLKCPAQLDPELRDRFAVGPVIEGSEALPLLPENGSPSATIDDAVFLWLGEGQDGGCDRHPDAREGGQQAQSYDRFVFEIRADDLKDGLRDEPVRRLGISRALRG